MQIVVYAWGPLCSELCSVGLSMWARWARRGLRRGLRWTWRWGVEKDCVVDWWGTKALMYWGSTQSPQMVKLEIRGCGQFLRSLVQLVVFDHSPPKQFAPIAHLVGPVVVCSVGNGWVVHCYYAARSCYSWGRGWWRVVIRRRSWLGCGGSSDLCCYTPPTRRDQVHIVVVHLVASLFGQFDRENLARPSLVAENGVFVCGGKVVFFFLEECCVFVFATKKRWAEEELRQQEYLRM